MDSITRTPTAEKRAALTILSLSVEGATNCSKMGSITPIPPAEKRTAFTSAIVSKAAPTAVKWAA